MRLSKRCEYALRALIDLGVAHEASRPVVRASELARRERIPTSFLEQILLQLRAAGYLVAKRGSAGGYSLAKPAAEVRMGDVVRLFERRLAPIACASETAYARCSCPDEAHCGLRLLMLDARNAVSNVLDRHTLADVVAVTMRSCALDRVAPPIFRSEELADETAPRVRRGVARPRRRVR